MWHLLEAIYCTVNVIERNTSVQRLLAIAFDDVTLSAAVGLIVLKRINIYFFSSKLLENIPATFNSF